MQRAPPSIVDMAEMYALRDRPSGRSRVRGPLLHAVPGTDRTRSAMCGARVGGRRSPWSTRPGTLGGTTTCPECSSLVERGAALVPAPRVARSA